MKIKTPIEESFYQERMIGMIDIIKIKKWLTETINAYKEDSCDDAITRWYVLDTDNNGNDLAIVCGWTDGFEDNSIRDWNEDGEYRLYMKFAYQPRTSLMQEYDIDWLMPYDEESNEVDDTEIPISDNMDDIKWLLEAYERYVNASKITYQNAI